MRSEGDADLEQQSVNLLLNTLRCLRALVQVAYVVGDEEPVLPEQRAFMRLLLVLARQRYVQVDMIDWREMYDILIL